MVKRVVVLVIFCLLVVLFLYPLIRNISTHTTSINDGFLIIWLTHQSANALVGVGDWYNWPFFYPYTYTSTFSDPFVTSGAVLIFIRHLTQNIVMQHNLLLLVAVLGNFWGMYLLTYKLWKNYFASLVSATIFSFSYTQYQFIPHLHTYMLFGLPLGLWAIISYLETGKQHFAILWGTLFMLQSLNAPMTAYFFLATTFLYLLGTRQVYTILNDKFFCTIGLLSCAVIAWYYLPYVLTAQMLDAARTIRDTAHFSYPIEKLLSLEIIFTIGIFILSFIKVRNNKLENKYISPQIIASFILVGAICMLGPVIKSGTETFKIFGIPIPLPYAVLYYLIPGIQAFRSVSRWAVILNFGLALGLGWAITQKLQPRLLLVCFTAYLALNFYLVQKNHYLYKVETQIPRIYTFVKESDKTILSEFPLYQWDMGELAGTENQRLIYQLYHGKTLYNGVSGITPPARSQQIAIHMQHFPDKKSLSILKNQGVELVLIHYDEFRQLGTANHSRTVHFKTVPSIQREVESNQNLHLIRCTDIPKDCLYLLTQEPRGE